MPSRLPALLCYRGAHVGHADHCNPRLCVRLYARSLLSQWLVIIDSSPQGGAVRRIGHIDSPLYLALASFCADPPRRSGIWSFRRDDPRQRSKSSVSFDKDIPEIRREDPTFGIQSRTPPATRPPVWLPLRWGKGTKAPPPALLRLKRETETGPQLFSHFSDLRVPSVPSSRWRDGTASLLA